MTSMEQPVATVASEHEPLNRDDLALASAFSPAESKTERLLLSIWEAVLNIRGLGVDDDFFELNGQSLVAVTLFTEIGHAFGKMPPVSTLLKCPTIRSLSARLDDLHPTARDSLVLPVRGQGRLAPLFYSHAARGNVLYVRKLLPFLNADRPVFAIQARGLQPGETPHRDFASMAADYVTQIQRIQPKGPYFLAGNCVGALIVFEMAQRLKALGEEVGAVVMIDPETNPHAVPWLYWRNPDAMYIWPWRFLLRVTWAAQRWSWEIFYRLSGRAWTSEPLETGPNRQDRQALLAAIKAAIRVYRPHPYDGKLTIVCCARRLRSLRNSVTGWPSLARQAEFSVAGGSHYDVFNIALPVVGATIERAVNGAQSKSQRPWDVNAA
jgi:thioesterase domain-containing protein